jgi:DNA polymerase III delta subunit
MIYIVHGSDLVKSRTLIVNQQEKLTIDSKIEVDIVDTSPDKLLEICSSADLFGNYPFVILDVSQAGRKNVEDYIAVLEIIPDKTSVVILSSKTLSKSNAFIKAAKNLSARTIENEKVPQGNVFKFVDYLFAGNRKATYASLATLLKENQDPFYILSMITYGLRNLAIVKFNARLIKKMSPYVKSKTERLVSKISDNVITSLYKELYDLDKSTKTGQTSPEMALTMVTEKVLNSV